MGNHMSSKPPETPPPPPINFNHNLQYTTELSSYELACKLDEDLQSFDTSLQARTNQVISTLANGVEVRAVSFDSLKEVTECLLQMNQEVVKVILECKKDIWKNQELFELVEEYFDNSLQTLDFCTALEKCLKRARDSQLLILVALQLFEEEHRVEGNRYDRTLEELATFKAAGDPFTEEFILIFQSVYRQQMVMLDKLQNRRKKLDKKLKSIYAWRKVSSIIFAATFATVLICSVVAAAMAAPPVAAALAAATSIPLGSMGKWIDSLWKNYENAVKGQKEVISSMQAGTYVAIKDLDNIRILIDRLVIDIKSLLDNADFAIQEEAVKVGIEEIRKKLGGFKENVEALGVQADMCSRDIRRARTVILQRIIKHPNH
ncbi:transmembrane protein, putative [Actinidia rufa]|uniref:Transmembrane protein, putative n=1 Tax=Actinidia rufa TaxID=165716 RepID=A0A7J0FA35_9ERIC|nr:transmembrane protein, putative [Actinidia rufa]